MKTFFGYVIRRAIYDTARNQFRQRPRHTAGCYTITAPSKPPFWFRLGQWLRAAVLWFCLVVLIGAAFGSAFLLLGALMAIL